MWFTRIICMSVYRDSIITCTYMYTHMYVISLSEGFYIHVREHVLKHVHINHNYSYGEEFCRVHTSHVYENPDNIHTCACTCTCNANGMITCVPHSPLSSPHTIECAHSCVAELSDRLFLFSSALYHWSASCLFKEKEVEEVGNLDKGKCNNVCL